MNSLEKTIDKFFFFIYLKTEPHLEITICLISVKKKKKKKKKQKTAAKKPRAARKTYKTLNNIKEHLNKQGNNTLILK